MRTDNTRVFRMTFANIYLLYIKKVEKKGRTKKELNTVYIFMTGNDKKTSKPTKTKEIEKYENRQHTGFQNDLCKYLPFVYRKSGKKRTHKRRIGYCSFLADRI